MQANYLSQLQDIQLPQAIGWWPLAWGWWVLMLFIILIAVTLVIWIKHYRQRRKARNQALHLLAQIDDNEPPITRVKQLNQILKRVVLVYVQPNEVAELSGKAWATWLNQFASRQGRPDINISADLVTLAYAPSCTKQQAIEYHQQVQVWITQLLPPNTNKGKSGERHV